MSQKQKYYFALGIIVILVAVSIYGLLTRGIGLGLDLKGGLNVVLTAQETSKTPVNQRTMDQAIYVMRNRVDKLGVSEPSIEQHGKRNIIIQLPGIKDSKKALDIIGQTALLEFAIVQDKYAGKSEAGLNAALAKKEPVLGPTLMTGDALTNAVAGPDSESGIGYEVQLDFNSKGAEKFAEITKNNVNKHLAAVLDGSVKTAPTIQEAITGGNARISGLDSFEEAKNVALVLQTGQLPFKLDISQQQDVGPTLGKDSLKAAFIAGIIGTILVALFLLGFYRVFGLISVVGLSVFVILLLGSMILVDILLSMGGAAGISLSLPSIAGIILMVGIAADSSIIILERIKEETRSGKSFRSAIDSGFSHGFITFLDADLVTFLTAAVLFYFGIGLVKGFAVTLMIGIAMDLTVSLLFKRSLLKLIASNNWIKNPALIGLRGVQSE